MANSKILLLPICIFILTCKSHAQVGIGTIKPNSSAQLDITATNKGLLIPRVNKANRPANAVTGLMIYQTDNTPGFYYFDGKIWKRLYAVNDNDTMVVNQNPGAATDPGPAAGATGTIAGADGIIYTSVRLGDGSIWLQQNLGSSRVATAVDDTESYGDLYQWGRWTDGHEKRTPVFSRTITELEPNPNNPNGLIKKWGSNVNPFYYGSTSQSWWWNISTDNITDSLTAQTPSSTSVHNGCDPCRLLLGSTWRMPTVYEYAGLIGNLQVTGTSITNKTTAFSSYLKFPVAGYRDYLSTTLLKTGEFGYYWSSTGYSAGYPGGVLNSGNFLIGVYINDVRTSGDKRGYGYSIRCKKD